MYTYFKAALLFILAMLSIGKANSQDIAIQDFYDSIKRYNLSSILLADSIIVLDGDFPPWKTNKAEPLGYIGEDYQRLYIHFISVIQNPENQHQYFLFGKTKVKGVIRPFQGTLTVRQASIGQSVDYADYRQGTVSCQLKLYEDKLQTATGYFIGNIDIHFVIDEKKAFRYDGLTFNTNGFTNNEFTGTWTSYATKKSKICTFGDYRFPVRGDLDIGADGFMPNPKYLEFGWKYYLSNRYQEGMEREAGLVNKKAKWWE